MLRHTEHLESEPLSVELMLNVLVCTEIVSYIECARCCEDVSDPETLRSRTSLNGSARDLLT